jgi:hypothetical protein
MSVAGVALALCIPGWLSARGDPEVQIDVLVVDSRAATFGSRLTISMDEPVSTPEAERVLGQLTAATTVRSITNGVLTATTEDPLGWADVESSPRAAVVHGVTPYTNPPPPPVGGNGYHDIHCDVDKLFSDSDGTFGVQRNCGVNKAPWNYTFSPGLIALCHGPVTERGLDWWVNANRKTRQAPQRRSVHVHLSRDVHRLEG